MSLDINEIVEFIGNEIASTYQIAKNDSDSGLLLRLRPKQLKRAAVLRIKRLNLEKASLKTLLCVQIDQIEDCGLSYQWAAYVLDELVNNQVSDLYLFIFPASRDILSLETCINLEANDQFCRKYVLRPNETLLEMLDRTFLSNPEPDKQLTSLSDPLQNALNKTAKEFSFLNIDEQELWRKALLSGKSGLDLASIILSYSLPKE